ncbi:MAG: UDP-N-acetylglucosamine 2-epimerase, partial [Parcubacteria group bacterium]|nr:UDP-N-acetylglucosamine 2-epimerase [Parcubacteria group bacterium]
NKNLVKIANTLKPDEPYLFMVEHPVTTEFQSAGNQIHEILEAIQGFKEQVIALWPNIDAGSEGISLILRRHPAVQSGKIKIFKHIPTEIFANVLRNATCFIGNSSSGIRESCYFGTPTVNVGSRQNERERGSNVLDVGYDRKEIADAIRKQIAHGRYPVERIYGDGTAGKQCAAICASVELPNIQKRITY